MRRLLALTLISAAMALAGCGGPPAATTEQIPFSAQPVNDITVKAELAKASGLNVELDNITTTIVPNTNTDNPDDYSVNVAFRPTSFWDEEYAVKIAVHSSIKAMELLFQNPAISEVVMWEITEFTDQYGATKAETAVRISMNREVAIKVVSWDKVDENASIDYYSFFNLATLQYIHPAILKGLK